MGDCIENAQSTIVGPSWRFNFYLLDVHMFKNYGHIFIIAKDLEPTCMLAFKQFYLYFQYLYLVYD